MYDMPLAPFTGSPTSSGGAKGRFPVCDTKSRPENRLAMLITLRRAEPDRGGNPVLAGARARPCVRERERTRSGKGGGYMWGFGGEMRSELIRDVCLSMIEP